MKIYQRRYFDRRSWILENISSLNLNSNEVLILLLIDYFNQYNEALNINTLSKGSNMEKTVVDDTISSLISKGYLVLLTDNEQVIFNIDNIFEAKNEMIENNDIFEIFEAEFGRVLSQKEASTISEWLRIYDYNTIIKALREALIYNKKSINYIDKILAKGFENE
ncbi:MAG TPA: DnaD domain protein [Erysipelotrichaceae bacterium]|jgi:DNA replication protein|nr:DnaD domain protein [Erysipelotrichia bacterium]HPX32913.1 DnaD domain protein [Erysipelotrichaceae bacterium]HQA85396.1 DnaD domain protein [Erysipelotrichaceae bacterium]